MSQTFERLPPEKPCAAPEGHDLVDIVTFGSRTPTKVLCTRCGRLGTVVAEEESLDAN